jgi:hypothetical protein
MKSRVKPGCGKNLYVMPVFAAGGIPVFLFALYYMSWRMPRARNWADKFEDLLTIKYIPVTLFVTLVLLLFAKTKVNAGRARPKVSLERRDPGSGSRMTCN